MLDLINSEEEIDLKKEEMQQFFASKGILVPDHLGNEEHQQQAKEDPADVELPCKREQTSPTFTAHQTKTIIFFPYSRIKPRYFS